MADFHGVVYTRKWVVNLILDIAGYTTDQPLLDMVVCEPSCGEGSFLRSITERLTSVAKAQDRFSPDELLGCVSAYDLDSDSIEVSKGVIVDTLTGEGMDWAEARRVADAWVCCADYLLSDPEPCDFVIGNPPYLRAAEIDPDAREEYCQRLEAMTKGCDIFVGFIQHGLDSLREGGNLTYICADRWLQNQYGKKLRGYMVDGGYGIDVLVRMYGVDAFEDEVDAYPSITRISKDGGDIRYADCVATFAEKCVPELKRWLDGDGSDYECSDFSACTMPCRTDSGVVPLAKPERVKMVVELIDRFPSLEDSGVQLGIGLATGRDKVFIVDDPTVVEPDRLLPAFNMRDHRRHVDKERWLVNPWTADNELIDLDDYPMTKAYFESHKDDLAKRHVAKKNGAYYRTIDKPNWSIYGREMLLWPDMATKADPVWSDGSKYPCHNCYWMISDTWDLKALAGLLMSEVAESFIDALGVKMRGGTLRFQAQYLRLIHVPMPEDIGVDTMSKLRDAFEEGNRDAATDAAREAYGICIKE